jgi:hypothetical protein
VVYSDSAWYARFNGEFLHSHRVDRIVGIVVHAGVAWLLFRTGGEGTDRLDWVAFIMY